MTLRAEIDNEETGLKMHRLRSQPQPGITAWRANIDLSSGQPRRRYSFKLLWNNRQLWFTPQGLAVSRLHGWSSSRSITRITARSGLTIKCFTRFSRTVLRAAKRTADGDKIYHHHAAGHDIILKAWDEPLTAQAGGSTFYGGDLDGISEKLPYLKSSA